MVCIEINSRHIQRGWRNSCFYNPVALALWDHYMYVHVGGEFLTAFKYGENFLYRIDKELRNYISVFDQGFTIQPATLILKGSGHIGKAQIKY